MIGRAQKAQSRYEAKVELQNLCAADLFFVSVTYQEGLMKMNEFMTALQIYMAN